MEPLRYEVMASQSLVQGQMHLVQITLKLYIHRYHLKFQLPELLHHNNFFLKDLFCPIF